MFNTKWLMSRFCKRSGTLFILWLSWLAVEALSLWRLAGYTSMKNKSCTIKKKFLSFYKSLDWCTLQKLTRFFIQTACKSWHLLLLSFLEWISTTYHQAPSEAGRDIFSHLTRVEIVSHVVVCLMGSWPSPTTFCLKYMAIKFSNKGF